MIQIISSFSADLFDFFDKTTYFKAKHNCKQKQTVKNL